jgi:hypothetical protein
MILPNEPGSRENQIVELSVKIAMVKEKTRPEQFRQGTTPGHSAPTDPSSEIYYAKPCSCYLLGLT